MVYFVLDKRSGLIKIGTTGGDAPWCLYQRAASIKPGFSSDLEPLTYIEGGEVMEAALHFRFGSKRTRGEWFDITTDDVLDIIHEYDKIGLTYICKGLAVGNSKYAQQVYFVYSAFHVEKEALRKLLRKHGMWFSNHPDFVPDVYVGLPSVEHDIDGIRIMKEFIASKEGLVGFCEAHRV